MAVVRKAAAGFRQDGEQRRTGDHLVIRLGDPHGPLPGNSWLIRGGLRGCCNVEPWPGGFGLAEVLWLVK